ncbi:PLP-dependent transferase [Tilletiaria anomala UBC 951]|uniref:PLP-dependent transferase n=1 Tax=Tilletiaria anomala (strain ATCC 24038 / CBS 436.72 / UBC 951) TaxID=1037660 RepID=A0A066WHX1_TILAU|nr:PLP-dependent transferase [Tilletiaria anomala UBC 951]KDN53386.1 PLP-dependent transferase [Tilletiaria anomala UBC 951]
MTRTFTHEAESEAHQIFRAFPGHGDKSKKTEPHIVPGIEHPGSTGVIYVMDRAMANGFHYCAKDWSNFGQGAPEVGQIPGASAKPLTIDLAAMGEGVHEYAPTTGVPALREAVARYYNQTYRQGKKSQYTAENVCIVPGGRAGLSRVASIIGQVMCGYQLPDYTAYENLLGVFKSLVPIPTQLSEEDHYKLSIDDLRKEIRNRGLSAVVLSNPRNPTGQSIQDEELQQLVQIAKSMRVSMILDEFYSWYAHEGPLGKAVSAAEFVEDCENDPIILIDGLTKNWRCPGWRCCWVVGPTDLVRALAEAGSFLDGGANHPLQLAAIPMLDPERCLQDRIALQKHFRMKRDHVLKRLEEMGLPVLVKPQATFYIWLNVGKLPHPLNSGMVFFEELLKEKVIVTPGLFFDLNPSHRRNIIDSPCEPFVRLSFGPPLEELDRGLDGIARVLNKGRAASAPMGRGPDVRDRCTQCAGCCGSSSGSGCCAARGEYSF